MINDEGTTVLNVREYMANGLDVYDVEKKKVGTVLAFDADTGYMTVRPHPFARRLLYVPFSAITYIDPHELFVFQSRDTLQRVYSNPPPRETVVRKRTDPDTGEDESVAITFEPSGYDGTPVVVEEANIGELAHHIAPGFRVWTSEEEDIGTIKEFDRAGRQLVVEQDFPVREDLVVPLAVVYRVDREQRTVHLAVCSADLQRHPTVRAEEEPADAEDPVEAEITKR